MTPENGGLVEKEIPNLETSMFRVPVGFLGGVYIHTYYTPWKI